MQTQLPPHCSPSPWDTSGLEQIKFQPFSQPRGMTDDMSWSCGSNPPLYQLETPTQVLFGGPEPNETEVRDRARHFSLNQPEDKEPMLDFIFNQSETEQHFEEDIFRGFSNEEYENEACQSGRAKSKICLKDGTPVKSSTPQTVPDSQCMGMELSNCSDINFSCPGHDTGPMNGCGYSPSYSCSGGYISSNSDDDEECCQPCLQASASSYVEQACCSEAVIQGSQGKPKQRHSQPRPLTPFRGNFRADQKIMEKVVCPDKALGSNSRQTESSTHQFASPHPLVQTQSSEICKCQKTSSETRDVETQTINFPAAETRDASTQCSVVADSTSTAPGLNLYLPPVDTSVQHPATGRQTGTAAQPHTASSGKSGSGGKHTPWGKKKFKAGSLSGSSSMNKVTANNSNGKVFQRSINHFLDGRVTENEEGRDERGRHGNGPLMKDLSDDAREEVTSATRGVNRPPEEAETLQEIADILLLLKQRKKNDKDGGSRK
ncbi:uncharacterized protein LOC121176576 [Toxotes jaculatrix]|uniref:uncharacterized protein LOC121176576 n=1 Tax=Toxotes jaculatrix TaxID=941984 RepID=UPI001B3A9A9B|nr:uncharacterized protein LOC121176576 [Toxotes jaculatrix]